MLTVCVVCAGECVGKVSIISERFRNNLNNRKSLLLSIAISGWNLLLNVAWVMGRSIHWVSRIQRIRSFTCSHSKWMWKWIWRSINKLVENCSRDHSLMSLRTHALLCEWFISYALTSWSWTSTYTHKSTWWSTVYIGSWILNNSKLTRYDSTKKYL